MNTVPNIFAMRAGTAMPRRSLMSPSGLPAQAGPLPATIAPPMGAPGPGMMPARFQGEAPQPQPPYIPPGVMPPNMGPGGPMPPQAMPPNPELYRRPMSTAMPVQPGMMPPQGPPQDPRLMQNIFARRAMQY